MAATTAAAAQDSVQGYFIYVTSLNVAPCAQYSFRYSTHNSFHPHNIYIITIPILEMSKLRHTVHTARTIADNLIFCGTSKPLEIKGQFLGPVNSKASSICPRKVQKGSSGLKPGECVQLCSGLSFQVMMESGGQSPCFPFSVESNIGNPRNVPTPGQS